MPVAARSSTPFLPPAVPRSSGPTPPPRRRSRKRLRRRWVTAATGVAGWAVDPQARVGTPGPAAPHARPAALLRAIERALGRARAADKGRSEVFDPALDPRAATLSQLEAELRRAIDSEDFRTH